MLKFSLSLLMMQAGVANDGAPPASSTLAPVGKWTVDGSDSGCTLSHAFGSDKAQAELNILPGILGESFRVVVLTPGVDGIVPSGKATMTLSPNLERQMTVPFRQVRLNGSRTATIMKGYGGADWYFAGTSRIRVQLPDELVDLATPNIDQALSALRKCHTERLKSWGVTPAEQKFIGPLESKDREYAIGNLEQWFDLEKYPKAALAARQEGKVTILWAIGVNGRVYDCRVVISSGVPSLDAATCNAVIERGRYRPILDEAGKPMVLHAFHEVNWRLPS